MWRNFQGVLEQGMRSLSNGTEDLNGSVVRVGKKYFKKNQNITDAGKISL